MLLLHTRRLERCDVTLDKDTHSCTTATNICDEQMTCHFGCVGSPKSFKLLEPHLHVPHDLLGYQVQTEKMTATGRNRHVILSTCTRSYLSIAMIIGTFTAADNLKL